MSGARSKTAATWLAIVGGVLGLHRFYLHGLRDPAGWLFPLPTLVGWVGVQRMQSLGQDDMLSWLLIPFGGLAVSAAMLSAILIGLTPDDKWAARYPAGDAAEAPATTAWAPIFGVVLALLIGGAALMGTIAFGGQKYFE
ncbi:MAG TPA: hypothetical protein VLA16_02135 [Ideonella sp.]|nr:hypothetical protein [Ideonella sp.]